MIQIYIYLESSKNYADEESFLQKKITPYFQKYNHPAYKQIRGDFEPFMSILDLIFNMGPKSKEVLMSGNISKKDILNMSK